ncbi:hypothetical protein [Paracoccus fontiphilus]|uniref:Uncharacterized protein n=1 Tax=Paracoccus fontiphilus TaxID=1815556 RepID=A0ABV7IMZ4_9RHOB|nr:hypothetical protein [Paracoccus fontiphilus]
MAKKQSTNQISASFHYLVKQIKNERNEKIDAGFSEAEFGKLVSHISNPERLDENDDATIARIKAGEILPFEEYEVIDNYLHFGKFEGAYYGLRYRNNLHGPITAESLNLREFYYLITRLQDGRVLIGATYNGNFGDYEGLRSCLSYVLRGNYTVASKTLTSISEEIGNGTPIEIKLTYRKSSQRPEQRNVFGSSGVIAIKNTEFGEGFGDEITRISDQMRGTITERKRALANIVNQGELLELDSEDIIGCTAVVREDKGTRTVYFLGGNNFATKFPLRVDVDNHGAPNREQVKQEMIRVMREKITPLLVN